MAWTEITRPRYDRDFARYASNLTDEEWALIERLTPSAKRLGRPRTAGVIDSQSVKTTESGGDCGFDGGKKIKGRKRHILTETLGFILAAIVHAADIQDRDGAPAVLAAARYRFPFMRHIFADGGYAGEKLRKALTKIGDWKIDIIKRADNTKGFHVLPRRWVVERTFACLGRSRRLAKDWERTIESALAWLFIAQIRTLTRRLARP